MVKKILHQMKYQNDYFFKMYYSVKIMILVIVYSAYFSGHVQAELKLLNVVFRHGDRAPMAMELEAFPNLFANETFFPVGSGGLTNKGKLRQFRLGQYLRRQYDHFLGDIYLPENVIARSTDVSRTIMSLQLVLAGLYPPKGVQRWNDRLNWQPIPFDFVPRLDDVLMLPIECPKYLEARRKLEAEALPKVRKKLETLEGLKKYLTRNTGKRVKNSFDLFFLYHTLMATMCMDLEPPSWTKNIFPHGQLHDATVLQYELFSYNDKLKKMNGGMLLRKIMENMNESATNSSSQRKIYLYSGHDVNVAALLQALDVYQREIPGYSSAVIIELHEESCGYFVKIKYYKGPLLHRGNQLISEELHNPHCRNRCSLDELKKILRNVIPSNEDLKCEKRSLGSYSLDRSVKVTGHIIEAILHDIRKEEKYRNVLH